MNYYQHHIGDYDSHTAHLSIMEDGVYRRLICLFYRTEKLLPLDQKELCRLIRANSKHEKKAVSQILKEFFVETADGYLNARCFEELRQYQIKAERNREVGQKGGRPRNIKDHKTQMVSENNQGGFETEPKNNPNQEPRTKNQEPRTRVETPQEFDLEPPTRRLRASRFALLSLPDDWFEFCKAKRPDLEPLATFERFSDYWRAKSGKDGTKLDWFATWRNWVRNERGKAGAAPTTDGITAFVEKLKRGEDYAG